VATYPAFQVTGDCHAKAIPIKYKVTVYLAQNKFLHALEMFADLYYVSANDISDACASFTIELPAMMLERYRGNTTEIWVALINI